MPDHGIRLRRSPYRRVSREHVAARPSWRCRVCGAPWPCSPARLALLTEYRGHRTNLLMYLAALMLEAAGQLPPTAAPTLATRFLTWARRPSSPDWHP
nr:flavin reductase [Micromonospora pallida]